MIFNCGGIVSLCGFDFCFEGAEVDSFSVYGDACAPSFHIAGPIDALIFGARGPFEFAAMPDVLSVGSGAQIYLSIVEAVVVDVVAEQAMRDVDD